MTIEFTLNTGKVFTASIPNFNNQEFVAQLNDSRITFITIGNNGFNKHILASWVEVAEESGV